MSNPTGSALAAHARAQKEAGMASEMVERVARAQWEARRTFVNIPRMGLREITDWNELPEDRREFERKAARAAIDAMREPTAKMVWEGGSARYDRDESTEEVYRDMIDEALR